MFLSGTARDLRFALRLLFRAPAFSAGAVLPLALAIGLAACAFTLTDAFLYRSIGIGAPQDLAAVYAFSRQKNAYVSSSYPDYSDLRSLTSVVKSAAAFVRFPVDVREPGGSGRFNAEFVAGDYFRTVAVQPALGRALGPADERPGAAPVAVVSESFREKHGAALGSKVWIDGVDFTVVGVAPRGFRGTLLDWYSDPAFWIPLPQIRSMLPHFRSLDYESLREMGWLMMLARLQPGANAAQLQSAADSLAGRPGIRFVALPAGQARFFPGRRAGTLRILRLFLGIAAAALAIACFNLANLLLARATARTKEIGVRQALGAGRPQLVRQLTFENLSLAVCACALGLPLASVLTGAAPAVEKAFGVGLDLSLDPRALAIAAAAGLLTSLLAGLAPALLSFRSGPMTAIKGSTPEMRSRHSRDVFVVAQIACAMIALVTAGILAQSLRSWSNLPLGYTPRGILLGTVDTPSAGLSSEDLESFYRRLLAELRGQSRGAALASRTLPASDTLPVQVSAAGRSAVLEMNAVSDGYFELLRVPVLAGRGVQAGDDARSQPVAILNRAAAKLLWPGQEPVGQRIQIRGEAVPRVVAGVVGDMRFRPLGEAETAQPVLFLPLLQSIPYGVTMHVQFPRAPLPALVARCAGQIPVTGVQTLEEWVQSGLSQVRLVSRASLAVGAGGVLLALFGIFAAGAYRVSRNGREIALKIALGAEPGRLIRALAVRGLLLGAAGSLAGLAPALWACVLIRSALRGVGAPGLPLILSCALCLAATAAAVFWAAARRISRFEPAGVLRVQ